MSTTPQTAPVAGQAGGVSGTCEQIVTALPNFVDFLAQTQPLSNLERQWIHQHNKKCAKKYHHCLHCSALLLRMNDGVKVFSPTNNWEHAFCRDNDGACKAAYLKTDTTVRVRKFGGDVPQPRETISLLPTSKQWDVLRDAPKPVRSKRLTLRNAGHSFRGSIGHGNYQPLIGPRLQDGSFWVRN